MKIVAYKILKLFVQTMILQAETGCDEWSIIAFCEMGVRPCLVTTIGHPPSLPSDPNLLNQFQLVLNLSVWFFMVFPKPTNERG